MMACVDFVDSVGTPGAATAAFGWLSPRISFSVDAAETGADPQAEDDSAETASAGDAVSGSNDFEFCLSLPPDDQMLPAADELFYQGKLMPLHPHSRSASAAAKPASAPRICDVISKPTVAPVSSGGSAAVAADALSVSPKAPKCSSRWKELLGLKRTPKSSAADSSKNSASKPPKTLKQLFRGCSAPADPANQPLLQQQQREQQQQQPPRDSDADSARISVSSDLDELPPRLSFETVLPMRRPPPPRVNVRRNTASAVPVRRGRSPYRTSTIDAKLPARGSSVDSPRMNSSGKIIYHSLERSCSSPSTFNANRGRDYYSHRRAMERSYSANVRVTPVLNVPVCALLSKSSSSSSSSSGSSSSANKGAMFGFTQLFVAQKNQAQSQNPGHSHSQSQSQGRPTKVCAGSGGPTKVSAGNWATTQSGCRRDP